MSGVSKKERQSRLLARTLNEEKSFTMNTKKVFAYAVKKHLGDDVASKTIEELSSEITFGQVFEAYQCHKNLDNELFNMTPKISVAEKAIAGFFRKAGYTRLDLIILPQETVTIRMMKALTKDEWLKKHPCILGTLHNGELFESARSMSKCVSELTLYDLFFYDDKWIYLQFKQRTQDRLYEIGFRYEDGNTNIMRQDTERDACECLMREYNISKKQALITLNIARSEWRVRKVNQNPLQWR